MNRRDLLKTFAAVPLVAAAPATASTYPVPKTTLYGVHDWKLMAEHLWANYQHYVADRRDWVQAGGDRYLQPICYRFCNDLLDSGDRGADPCGLTSALFPSQDLQLIKKNVVFGVTDVPTADFRGMKKPTQARRMRMPRVDWDAVVEMIAECPTYHGISQEFELVAACGEELAFDVKREIRADWKAGQHTEAYVFYLPPHVGLVDPKMLQDFSICRRWTVRYAKFYT